MHVNLHANVFSRSKGASAVAKAAYRAGEKLHDARQDRTHDYSRKGNVEHAEIIAPAHAPEWAWDREQLWNQVEAAEKRKDAQLAREVVLTLPRGLTADEQRHLVHTYVADTFTWRGMVADVAIHNPDASDGEKNPHAHVMLTLRELQGDGFGPKRRDWNGRENIGLWRQNYQEHLNRFFEGSGEPIQFDLRSLREKGIDRQPQAKLGPAAAAMERKGLATARGREVRRSQHAQPYARRVNSYQLIGGGSQQPAFVLECMRADIARTYYEVMFGEEWAKEPWEHDR